MVEVPGWAWQLALFAGGGLALGVVMGAVLKKRKPSPSSNGSRSRGAKPTPSDRSEPAADDRGVDIRSKDTAAKEASPSGTPQQRLLERLREKNLQLAAQVKSATDQHARQMSERQQEQQAETLRRDRQVEELRQLHSAEFSQLLEVVFEQVDRLQVAHSNQTQALGHELERLRRVAQGLDAGGADESHSGPDVRSVDERLELAARDVRQTEFAATRVLESLRKQH